MEHRHLWCNMTTSIARSCPYDRREPDQLEDATERPVEERECFRRMPAASGALTSKSTSWSMYSVLGAHRVDWCGDGANGVESVISADELPVWTKFGGRP